MTDDNTNDRDIAMMADKHDESVLLEEAMDLLCGIDAKSSKTCTNTRHHEEAKDKNLATIFPEGDSFAMEDLVSRVHFIFEGEQESSSTDKEGFQPSSSSSSAEPNSFPTEGGATPLVCPSSLQKLAECFQSRDKRSTEEERMAEFQKIEAFIKSEQNESRGRRSTAQKLEASEEKRLAAEVAQLKGMRLKSQIASAEEDLRWKISDAQRAFVSRKMVYAKASQVAGAEMRSQFARVRDFNEQLHQFRQDVLYKQHCRTLSFQTLMHRLKGTDARVVSLDRQIQQRLYHKKKNDLNEQHMAQTLEEAVYLDSMKETLDKVQICKENAAREVFELHVNNLKAVRENNSRRQDEVDLLAASATLEMAKLVAHYADENAEDEEEDNRHQERVDLIERTKEFDSSKANSIMSITTLYDTIVYNVAANDFGLTTSGSSLYSSDFDSEMDCMDCLDCLECEEREVKCQDEVGDCDMEHSDHADIDDADDQEYQKKTMTPNGRIHTRQLAKQLKAKERALLSKHKKEILAEQREYQRQVRELKAKHQTIIDQYVQKSLVEREALREAITERMEALVKRQEESTELMREKDLRLMKEALRAEDQRVEEAEAASFMKAQELISAQVFHEVRNALSAVIAMSEMTNTLKKDDTMSATELIGSVDDMLDQIGDVVNYALKMLNEILDVSKINSGAFQANKEVFDLQKVVNQATRMQLAKASRIKMSFSPSPQPFIAISDSGIVERMVATLISNAVKFTSVGAVQPFVCPLEAIQTDLVDEGGSSETSSTASMSSSGSDSTCDKLKLANNRVKLVAVGVADTGAGLTEEKLQSTKFEISTSNSKVSNHGAQNTGFGLYHAHLQARALNTTLQLSSLSACREILNDDMINASKLSANMILDDSARSIGLDDTPGQGTVLYFTVPVYVDSESAEEALEAAQRQEMHSAQLAKLKNTKYTFKPLPSPTSEDGCFRVLVADDVLMLRKGMVHTIGKLWSQHFPNCPVSVSTACTAEDVLRATETEPFDLIICDHHFNHDESNMNLSLSNHPPPQKRPRLHYLQQSASAEVLRRQVKEFFDNERFTVQEEDGSLLGKNALIKLAENTSPKFPTPILMLVSGHKIDINRDLGIVVVQKPLKQVDFISTLESHALDLLRAGRCEWKGRQEGDDLMSTTTSGVGVKKEENDEDQYNIMQNIRGSQVFESSPK